MKTMKRVFSLALLVVLVLSLSVNAFAAKGPRSYTLTVFPGNNGTISGDASNNGAAAGIAKSIDAAGSSESVTIAGDGKSLTFNGATVTVSNEKYYIRGVREAGKDGDVYGSNAAFPVTQDTDMVVVYGMMGNAVQYTVRYLDRDGVTPMSQVAPGSGVPTSSTGYGPADDAEHRPIVGAYPIDGYVSYAMNSAGQLVRTDKITMTLSADGENVFTFYYIPVEEAPGEEPAEEPVTPETPETPETPAEEQPTEQQTAQTEDEPAAAENAAAANDAAAEEPETVEIGDEEVPLAEPEDILDMDVPLANAPGGIGGNGIPASWTEGPGAILANHAVMAGIGGGVIVIAIALWLFLRSRRKDKTNAK